MLRCQLLRKQHYDVVTAHDVGMLQKSDRAHLQYAISQERTIVTHNRNDFLGLHSEWIAQDKKHFGIVILVRRIPFGEMTARLLKLLNEVTADEMENQLRFV